MNKISVIVPVYNAEKYIDKCIDSIIQQTYDNWELLLVDDGSTDKSGSICDKWAESDSRIRVFHVPNGGVSEARNIGLQKVSGEVLTFVDADDWLNTDTLKEVSVFFNDFDFVRVSMNYVYSESEQQAFLLKETESWQALMSQILSRETILGVCSAFYKTCVVKQNNITFNKDLRNGEDWLFTCQYLKNTNRVKVINKAFYQYNKQNESSCTNNMTFEKSKESYVVADIIRQHYKDEKSLLESLNAGQIFILLSSLHDCFKENSFKAVRKRILMVKHQMSPIHLKHFYNSYITWSQKIHLFLFGNIVGQFVFFKHISRKKDNGKNSEK